MDINWQEPPVSRRGRGKWNWAEIVAALKKRPGAWALIGENVSASNGRTAKAHGLEYTTRGGRTDGLVAEFYVRWPEGGED